MNGVIKAYGAFEKVKLVGVWISGISLFGMMLFIVMDVILRNVFSASLSGGFEMVQNYFMTLTVFPALAYVYASGVLPKMDLLMVKLTNSSKKMLIYGMVLLEILVLGIMFYFTILYALDGLERGMSFPAAGTLYPIYPLLFLVPLAFAMVIIENIFIIIRNLKVEKASLLFKDEEEQDIGE
ncbi:TRAP transporter small permease [Halalkalibacillus halophilus]|uniref:TRAP transporter small permease n=1 Tax=Halalkalibacillus halophilus TaxID=392827 RepID=UPI0003F6EE02|nr:TRAP transporter small permease subunit [Halalkalibacillus halophilus]